MAEAEPAAKKPRQTIEPSNSTDEARWTEVFWMLHDGGQGERGPHYALTIANLKKRADDIDAQVEALRQAEGDLLKAACAEVLGQAHAEDRSVDREQALTWGRALAKAVEVQSTEAARLALVDEPLDAPTQLSIEAQKCAQAAQKEQAEAKKQAEAERQAQQAAQAEHVLAQQAAAMQQAQAMAEQHAQVLAKEAMVRQSEMFQLGDQSHAWLAALGAGGSAPLGAGGAATLGGGGAAALGVGGAVQALASSMVGQASNWNNPEIVLNSRGYPMRPGQTPCAFYLRTGVCKYVGTCKYDHPEMPKPA